MTNRREVLHGFAAAWGACALPSSAAQTWDAGNVVHLLSTVSYNRILLKASFDRPLSAPPRLRAGAKFYTGQRTDARGQFWAFDAIGLEPSRPHELQLVNASGRRLCDPWTLKTFPAPSERPQRLRLLIYTCAGGHDVLQSGFRFLPATVRARLLARGLSFEPDALIANGDHVYWDLLAPRASRYLGASPEAIAYAGRFNRSVPVMATANETVFLRATGPQILPLYGTRCRSTPVFFLQDDHDYFDNDEADDKIVTFPPDHFMLALARATQRIYYPEFLPDLDRPSGLPGASAADRFPGVSECFGTLRFGKLAEILLYDIRRTQTLAGPSAVFVSPVVEEWLKARMLAPGVTHVVNVPSNPPGWSAGKWGEWYADLLEPNGKLGVSKPKPYWQQGWRDQHDRLLQAASAMPTRIPLFISGDLHSIAEERIFQTGPIDLRANPVVAVLPGPLGTSDGGWPSAFRGIKAMPPVGLDVDQGLEPIEENGFLLADFDPESVVLRYFRWDAKQPVDAIETLQPFRVTTLKKPG
jgi:hypothetical protein